MDATSLLPALRLAVAISTGLTVAGHYLRPPRHLLVFIFKPLTTVLIIVTALLPGTFLTDPYARLIVIGLLFSLAGDIFLVMPDDAFLYGLIAFLLAQISYSIAFRSGAEAAGFVWPLLFFVALGAGVLAYLWKGVPPKMRVPVAIYVTVIISMAALAAGRALGQPSPKTISAAMGAALFVASDALLAVNRFRRPFYLAEAIVLITYFAAQWLIALSV